MASALPQGNTQACRMETEAPRIYPACIHRFIRMACLPGVFIDFLAAALKGAALTAFFAAFLAGAFLAAAFLAGDFVAAFFAGAFLAAFFDTAFFAGAFFTAFFATVFFAGVFFAAFLADAFFRPSPTELIASLTASATFDAIPSPVPIAAPAFSRIVSSAIFSPLNFRVNATLGIVEAYRNKWENLLHSLSVLNSSPSFAPSSFCQNFPRQGAEKCFDSARAHAFSAELTPTER